MKEYNDTHLAHHGIKGQKWGIRRFQNKDGSLTDAGKKHRRIAEVSFAKKPKPGKSAKTVKELEEARKAKITKEVIKNPKKLYKYKDELTKDELNKIISDIEFDRKVKDIRASDYDRFNKNLERLANTTQKVSTILSQTKNGYNVVADTYNMLVDIGKVNGKHWGIIGGKNNKPDSSNDNND